MKRSEHSLEELFLKLSPAGRRAFFDRCLADDFFAFLRKVFETVCPERAFLETWLVESMAHAAESIIDGKTKRLIVNAPPRHLKSINFTVALPAFLLGRDPTMRIICVSYSSELAIKHAIDFRAVVNAPWYKRAFPNTKISREKDTQHETMTTARGYRYATSVTGTLTGRGADIIIIDDPQKPDEALSEAQRKTVGEWYDTTLLSRLDSKSEGVIVLVMQRVHEDDLAGRLLEKGGWKHLKVPAIAEADERILLGGRRFHRRKVGDVIDPKGDSCEALMEMKRSLGELYFSAQYQQEPIPAAGNLIKAVWFKSYDTAPQQAYEDRLVISVDTAMKGTELSDFSVATVWLVKKDNCYLIDLWRERVDYPNLKRAVLHLVEKHRGATLLIEDKGSGTSLIQDLRAENRAVIAINPEGDKLTRLAKVSAHFEAGCVHFPKEASWLGALTSELLGFPNMRHDDQVDSVTQALNWILLHRQKDVSFVCPIIVTKPRIYVGDPGWRAPYDPWAPPSWF
jgi:predicted phage terminase large subunit-like protein